MKNQKYKEKMRYAKKVYEKDFIELKKMGVAIAKFTRFQAGRASIMAISGETQVPNGKGRANYTI